MVSCSSSRLVRFWWNQNLTILELEHDSELRLRQIWQVYLYSWLRNCLRMKPCSDSKSFISIAHGVLWKATIDQYVTIFVNSYYKKCCQFDRSASSVSLSLHTTTYPARTQLSSSLVPVVSLTLESNYKKKMLRYFSRFFSNAPRMIHLACIVQKLQPMLKFVHNPEPPGRAHTHNQPSAQFLPINKPRFFEVFLRKIWLIK